MHLSHRTRQTRTRALPEPRGMLLLLIWIVRVLFSLVAYEQVVLHAVALAGRVGALARGLHLRLEVAFAFALVVSENVKPEFDRILAGSVLILLSACPQKK
jgi:hypothetical protein